MNRRALLATPALLPGVALAQAPTQGQARAVTITVPFPPGGSTDVTARILAERMAGPLGLPVQVENRPGAATVIGADFVARAAPDGHTVLIASGSTLTINPHIVRNIPYRAEDFAAVTLISTLPFAIVARPDGPPTLEALMARARANPGSVTYGTNGPSSFNNIAMLLVNEAFGVRMQDVTYRGDAAQVADFLGGRLDLLMVGGSTGLAQHRAGSGRILAWTGDRRMPGNEEVPLVADFRPGLQAQTYFGLLVPARTPAPMVQRLNAAAVQAIRTEDFRARMLAEGIFAIGSTPEEFASFMRVESERWGPLLRRMDITG
ncbi:tripartite tricarboxylate transporter substrate binding protein [Sediminicoccus sp. KRV36]|uniref:Bug family tripartite tricarboxylate transporter substrate binding protein n=1 Tax=Sediminicoccus sp. KRV36 TaxID=3133721 RepID=UPI00200DC852|nr:tripartite tricarboxylate transporter substrate binding protein [Sediminicoccus rosea]UPY38439.1 tripartite tricarboxylate transporter substrate binding protein [Sediminicoccus rosea]